MLRKLMMLWMTLQELQAELKKYGNPVVSAHYVTRLGQYEVIGTRIGRSWHCLADTLEGAFRRLIDHLSA